MSAERKRPKKMGKTFGELTPEELCDLMCGTAEEEERMPEEYENAIEWLDGQKTATVTLHSQKQKTAMLRLAKAHPDKVKVIVHPRGNGGFLVAHLPVSWIQFKAPLKRDLTEERKKELREHAKAIRTLVGNR